MNVENYMSAAFSEKFRSADDSDGWVISLDVDNFV